MQTETEEAINYMEYFYRCITYPPAREACRVALSALRAQQEAETNEPLTPKELDQLERYPIFVVPLDEKDAVPGWCIYQRGIAYTDSLLPPLSYLFYRRDYGVRWVAYHRPPKEAHDAPNPR